MVGCNNKNSQIGKFIALLKCLYKIRKSKYKLNHISNLKREKKKIYDVSRQNRIKKHRTEPVFEKYKAKLIQ